MADTKNETGVAKGFLLSPATIEGKLSNATLRGMAVVLQVSGTTLQWRYEDETEWRNLIDLNDIDYEALQNLPQINGVTLTGNKSLDDLDVASKHNGLANITRNGTTFTVTRADGTTFTFDQQDTTYVDATASASGLMSASDKEKMDNIEQGAQANVIESISINGDVQAIDEKNVNIVLPLIDDTLSVTGRPADAKATGDAISGLEEEIAEKQDTLPFATPTSEDIGKALMPKIIENGKVTEWEFGEAGMVDDVQINGTSIVENKVANIPAAGQDLGLVRINSSRGINVQNGMIFTNSASATDTKTGTDRFKPIVPYNQYESTFYGLAKVAGHDEKDSTLPVGQYSDEAKTAIKDMLGVSESPVQDVQINGTSILNEGVANVPIASDSNLGLIKVADGTHGVRLGSDNTLRVAIANAEDIKSGQSLNRSIMPGFQSYSVFYGLAKAAGDITQSASANTVGTYTDQAKTAIQTMLGIDTAIADAVGEITSFDFQVVTALPSTGTKGVIYLVAHSHGSNDGYDEYIWINNAFEKLGHTDIDLTDYLQNDDISTDAQVNAMLQEIGIVE